MNIAELKLDLFRKIDRLSRSDLEVVYSQVLDLLDSASSYNLKDAERSAIEEALEYSKEGKVLSHGEVVEESRKKYPNLKFQ